MFRKWIGFLAVTALFMALSASAAFAIQGATSGVTSPAADVEYVKQSNTISTANFADLILTFGTDSESWPNNIIITVTLGGGATLGFDMVSGDVGYSPGAGTVVLVGTPKMGDTSFELQITDNTNLKEDETLTIQDASATGTPFILNLSGVSSSATVTVTVTNELRTLTYLTTTARTIARMVDAIKIAATTDTVAKTDKIDVAAGKMKLENDDLTTPSGAKYNVTNPDNGEDLGIDYGALLYTVSGDLTAVSGIGGGNVYGCDASGTTQSVTGGQFYLDTTNNMAYACGTALAENGELDTSDLVITFTGTTVIPESSYGIFATLMSSKDSEYASDVSLAPFTWLTLTNNGYVAHTPYFFAGESGSDFDTFAKFHNMHTEAAEVFVEVYSDDGAYQGTYTLTSIPAGQVGIFWGSDIATAAGMPTGTAFAVTFSTTAPKDKMTGVAFFKRTNGDRQMPLYTGTAAAGESLVQ